MGGLGIRSARRHAPSAFIGSVHLSSALVLELCGYSFPSSYTADAFQMLSEVVGHSDWSSFEDLDFTISQRTLSRFIDQYSFGSLSTSAPDNRAKALLSSPHQPLMQVIGSVLYHLPLLVFTSMTLNLDLVCCIG